MWFRGTCALLGFLFLSPLPSTVSSESLQTVVQPSKGVSVEVSTDLPLDECSVCTVSGVNDTQPSCYSSLSLDPEEEVKLLFQCSQSIGMSFTVKVFSTIECTQSSCTPAVAEVDPNLLKDFNRIMQWDISIPDRTVVTFYSPSYRLKDISTTENCQDGYKYTVSTTGYDGTTKTSCYCRGGTVSQLDLLGATTVTLELPNGGELDQTVFNVKAAPRLGRIMSVTSDPNTVILISRVTEQPDCSACVNEGSSQNCDPQFLTLSDPKNTSVEFTCPQPQDIFNVEINREIDCTKASCLGDVVHAEATFFPDFNRTFTWDLKVNSPKTFQLDFPEPGMRQIRKEETCSNDNTYSLTVYLRTGPANIGAFCKGGPVNTILVRYKGRVSLKVPGNAKLDPVDFKLNVGPETSMLAIVKVGLPRGVSDTDIITPNYPGKFPDLQQMQWEFTVPGMHNYSIQFSNQTSPECLSGDVVVEYQKEGPKVTDLGLMDPQPQHQQGDFIMVLKNCETNTTLQGLRLSYRVSVMRSGHPVPCTVDLTKLQDVSLQIEKVGSDPFCEVSINSVVQETINITKGTTALLSFLDCPNDDLRLTANQVIGCQNAASCPSVSLTVPPLDSCLPMPLHSFTWLLSIPKGGSLDLASPTGGLRQFLPGQECDRAFSLSVAEADGFSVGDFCLDGVIQKVQVNANVTVRATEKDLSKIRQPFLNVSVGPEIPETIVYRVSPTMSSPSLLATPNWPQGMKPFSTTSWIVSLPSQHNAHLQFVNVSQPKCAVKHTEMKVKVVGQEEELMSRREDEKVENVTSPQSFHLIMSNCKPEEGQFAVLTRIVLQKKSNLLVILLGLLGALLLLIIVLVVVCIVAKKKKHKGNSRGSMYFGKGNIFRPSDRHFTKTQSDNNSHVYDYIDDRMVYGHLLTDSNNPNSSQDHPKGMLVDSYQTFTGPTDGPLPTIEEPDPEPEMDQYRPFLDPSQSFMPSRPRTPIGRQDSLGFQDRRMMDNELFTFKSTGEINTISLSRVNLEPREWASEESL